MFVGAEGLYPLEALIEPIALRFKYHFEGTRQTNRLDKVYSASRTSADSWLTSFPPAGMVLYACAQYCT